MKIETHQIEVACGGLCQFLGENSLSKVLMPSVYERVNEMVIKGIGTMNMEHFLNSATHDTWKVIFIQGQMSHIRHQYIFVRVEGK